MTDRPTPEVLDAFGLSGEARRLTGGKGGTWQCGDTVLKPAEGEPETIWRAEVLSALPPSDDFRIARPRRARTGAWIVAGWEATAWVAGDPAPTRAAEVIRTGEAFHRAIAEVPRPSFLDTRDDPWSYGDRLAFGDPVPPGTTAPSTLLEPLLSARRPITTPSQVVHGDLTGNVLFAPGRPPAVIDWPAYHRPPAWSAAVVVADNLVWHHLDPARIPTWSHFSEWPQMLIRALIYRISTWPAARWDLPPDDAYRPTVDHVLAYAGQ